MKKYKYLYRLVLVCLFTLGYAACTDDFLDEEPLGQPSSATLFADAQGAIQATNGIYAHLRDWDVAGFAYFGIRVVPSDDADVGSVPGDGERLRLIDNFTYDASTLELQGYWTGAYQGINYANQVIYNIPEIEMDDELKARLIGEAKFLRAWFYFNLVRAFGEVPIIDKVYTEPEDARVAVPKSPEEEVYNFIIKDLEAAIAVLPLKSEYPASELGRATKGAAQGMLAKVYLFRQDYAKAQEHAGAVIESGEYSLHPVFREVFLPAQENGSGSLFEAPLITREERDIPNEHVKWQGVRENFGWGFNSPSEDLSNAFAEDDPRREATIFYDGEALENAQNPNDTIHFPDAAQPRANQKTMLPGPRDLWPAGYPENSPTNMIILRYADVLLIYAEASNELGQTAEALTYLNMVRERARGENPDVLPDIAITDKVELRHIIWHERRVELAMEGHRFFDLIRQDKVEPGRATEILHGVGKTNFDINRHGTFPIPQVEIDASGGVLKQKAGW